MTFSFHVLSSGEIKCYLLWQGQCHRFYMQDIITLLPEIFIKNNENQHFAASDYAKRLVNNMTENNLISDKKFEQFYRAFNDKKENEFPIEYKYQA